jgi:hypothetical protein
MCSTTLFPFFLLKNKDASEFSCEMQISVVMARDGGSRMKKPCDCCKRYLDHLDVKNQNRSCFLRHMTANFKHSMVKSVWYLACLPTYMVFFPNFCLSWFFCWYHHADILALDL